MRGLALEQYIKFVVVDNPINDKCISKQQYYKYLLKNEIKYACAQENIAKVQNSRVLFRYTNQYSKESYSVVSSIPDDYNDFKVFFNDDLIVFFY